VQAYVTKHRNAGNIFFVMSLATVQASKEVPSWNALLRWNQSISPVTVAKT